MGNTHCKCSNKKSGFERRHSYTFQLDWLEDAPDGKRTSHLLQLSLFQLRINEKCEPILLDSEKRLTLTKNSFDQLLECETPPKEFFTVLMAVSNYHEIQLS